VATRERHRDAGLHQANLRDAGMIKPHERLRIRRCRPATSDLTAKISHFARAPMLQSAMPAASMSVQSRSAAPERR
jgi:hypothetical protein